MKVATDIVLAEQWLTPEEVEAIRESALQEVAEVEAFADESEIARPPVDELLQAVFAD